MNKHSCFKVQNYVQEKNSIGYAVKSDPRRAHVVIKESNGDRQDEHIHDQHGENHEIPIEPEKQNRKNNQRMENMSRFHAFCKGVKKISVQEFFLSSSHLLELFSPLHEWFLKAQLLAGIF